MNIKNLITNVKNKIVSLYTGGTTASYVAIGATAVTGIAAVTIGSVALISALTSEPEPTTQPVTTTTIVQTTTEEETTLPPTTTETTVIETTTPEPTTTETSVIETTTEVETTTPPPTIAIEDLDIGSKEEEATAETRETARREEFYEEETEEPTTPKKEPSTENGTEAPTEPPTEAPVSEYACVVKGIDVSKWNSIDKDPIDWVKVKNSGVKFVIIRAGYRGQTSAQMYADPYFEEHIEGALAAGLQVGVYFYSQAITEEEALEEASFLLSIIKDYKLTYPVCFDWEPVAKSRAGQAKLTKTEASAIARKFLSTMEGYGYEAMLYSYHSAIKTYFNAELTSDYKVWMARYLNAYKENGREYAVGDKLPEANYPYQMWQYTDTGTVPGIEGWVDMNVSFFSYTGSGVPNSAIVLNLPATNYTMNKGEKIDYKTGVKAFNTAGMDVSSSITYEIKDAKGNVVTEANAFKTPGKYTITYTIKDFTGISKSATASLTVRDNPKITLSKDTLTFNRRTTVYDTILKEIKKNISSAKDFEGNAIDLSTVTITGIDAFYNPDAATESSTESTSKNESSSDETTSKSDDETSSTNASEETSSNEASSDESSSADESTEASSDESSNGEENSSDESTEESVDDSSNGEENSSDESTEESGDESSNGEENSSNESTEDTDDSSSNGESSSDTSTEDPSKPTEPPLYINGLAIGTYKVTYKVKDKNGLETTATVTIIITD